MLRLFSRALTNNPLLHNNIYQCYIPHLMTKHYAELTMKATRRTFLSKTVLNQSKDIILGEIRKPTDYILKLKQEGKCAGVIIPYSKNKDEEIDIVVHGKAMKTRQLSAHYPLEKVYVRVEGKDHLCVLAAVKSNIKNFIQKVYFKQYVPGKANYLTVPINLSHFQLNKFFHGGYNMQTPVQEVDIISYNHQYPTRFNVDVSFVNPDRPYRVGDLANTFPPGIILNPKVDPNKIIFSVQEDQTAGQVMNSAEQILANINYGKDKKEDKTGSGTPAAGGKTDAAKGDAGKTAGKVDAKGGKSDAKADTKTDAKAAPAKKK